MLVYASSDFHGNLPKVPDCDLLLIAGDICPDFAGHGHFGLDETGTGQADWLDTVFRDWLNRLIIRGIAVVAIWGNHDFVGEHPSLIPELPWTLLQDSETNVNGLRIWGTPWCPNLPKWAFYASDSSLAMRAQLIPENTDILMSHTPPYGAGDMVGERFGPGRVGDLRLTHVLPSINPKLLICGHIHEDHGHHWARFAPNVDIRNVSYVDEYYVPTNPPERII